MEKICGNKCCNLIKRSSENISSNIRSSRPEVFLRKGVLKICSKFTGEDPSQSAILIKLLYNFIKTILRHGSSPVNFLHIFRTCISQKHLRTAASKKYELIMSVKSWKPKKPSTAIIEICWPEYQTGRCDIARYIFWVSFQHETKGKCECSNWLKRWETFEDVLTEKKYNSMLVQIWSNLKNITISTKRITLQCL